jgi:hypothetical protein
MSNGDDEAPKSAIPLAKAIQDLRNELLQAVAEGEGKELRFKLDPVELELSLGMTYKGGANAGVKFWVLDLGAKGDLERATTHKLKLKLNPVDKNGNQFMVRDTVEKMPN